MEDLFASRPDVEKMMHNLAQSGALNGAPQICELPLVYFKKIEAKKKLSRPQPTSL